jgi:PAS domain S-box-containing protein
MMANAAHLPDWQQPTFEDLERLVEVSRLLTLHDLGQVMQQAMELTASAAGAQEASLFLHNGTNVDWNYVFTARSLSENDSVKVVETVLDEGLAGWVIRNRKSAIVVDTEQDERWHVFPDDKMLVRSALCVPLMNDDEVVAVMTLVHPQRDHFTDYHQRLTSIIANQVTVAIRNTQLLRRLREKQQQLQTLLHSVPEILLVTDEDGAIILINDGARALLNLAEAEAAISKHLFDFAPYIDVIKVLQSRLSAVTEFGEMLSYEVRSMQLERDYAVNVSTWDDEMSQRRGYVIVMHDVTTLRNLYRFKDEMLRIVSHDLRSPLSIIAGYNDMIESDVGDVKQVGDYTDAIKRAITRMNDLLEDLLKVRQIDEKGLHLEPDMVLIDLVRPAIQQGQMLARPKKQIVQSAVHIDDTVIGTVDTTLLRQAMENYVSNAVKYTQEGGTITVRAFMKEQLFYFEVEDNGMGIPEASLPYLFESFYRVNSKSNSSIYGAGLGLSLVKSIVERHGGQVYVTSEEGVGSTFGMSIPV